ncbi:TonB-dependent receptor [Sandaracinobacter sp. RS1-74]|uniref:TonB-dependent receptor plug domain-containing protein n=1 Tax=Sandaracinobacteroides sayramensis TaxID=2913411 RepID=UPI001EDBD4A3|nr:TonB-dependent receptor [Sandaracinobacteroides sayramensis]MCG2842514.1 TonB-dependent receptor [Sandaracinobacteroides sayramensis]
MKRLVVALLGCTGLAAPVFAQASSVDTASVGTGASADNELIIVTGSRIKRSIADSPVPLTIVTTDDLRREGINSPEQFISFLTSNGNGLDNLSSNADVVAGAARGNNGASAANLRGQGASATLILLNGRRVPAHGLNGGVVDINQIPLSVVERVEVLKDGASAIYGTDAVGGVINFITYENFQGAKASANMDVTEAGGGNQWRFSFMAGHGDLDKDRFNLMFGASITDQKMLRGNQRDFVNTFQPDRGLSVDTRGTPFATIFPLGVSPNSPNGTIINSAATAPYIPGSATVRAGGGINPLDLSGGQGCDSIDGMGPYDELLWDTPTAKFACAWDTGRAAVLQQPIRTISYFGAATGQFGDHRMKFELTGSQADSRKIFSNNQLSSSASAAATALNYVYVRNAASAAVYDRVFNQLVSAFPELEPQRGLPMALRWRCMECGPREIETSTDTMRLAFTADGPIAGEWEYHAGVSYGKSESSSTLGSGYFYTRTVRDANGNILANGMVDAFMTGHINPFLLPGESQTAEAMALLEAISAKGVKLYGGKYGLWQVDASAAGPLFDIWGGTVQAAVGLDWRREQYSFNGDAREAANRPHIFNAPFDDANILQSRNRDVKAAYVEVMLPVFTGFELTGAFRIDDYTGFGTTTNPKITARYRPIPEIMFRGSYNTSFRVPTFNQLYNGVLESPYSARDIYDPTTCPGGRVDTSIPGCEAINPTVLTGGRPNLGPETARQFSAGVVFEPLSNVMLSADWWYIRREGKIDVLTIQDMVANYDIFTDRFIRDGSGQIVVIDRTWVNSGETITSGIEFAARAGTPLFSGNLAFGFDGSLLLKKRSRLVPGAPQGESEVGRFTFSGDLGLKWKHNIFLTYAQDGWSASLSQLYRSGYRNQELPGVTLGRVSPSDLHVNVRPYVLHNLSVGYEINERFRVTGGIKNLFDKDPPFAINYDSNTGSGSSWEPRVADPRGRSYTLSLELQI